jgi:quercetin 2,3-dioxygenase
LRKAYVQVVRGEVEVNGTPLAAADGAMLEQETRVELSAGKQAEVLVFDLEP